MQQSSATPKHKDVRRGCGRLLHALNPPRSAFLLTLGAHAPQGYGIWSVCVSVCLSVCPAPRVLPLRATERPTEGSYGFVAIWETF